MFAIRNSDIQYWKKTLNHLIHEDRFMKALLFTRPTSFSGRGIKALEERGIKAFCGASKLVFVSNSSDLVVKIPLKRDADYCDIEAENYQEACKSNLHRYFAGVGYMDMIHVRETISLDDVFNMEQFNRLDVERQGYGYRYGLDELRRKCAETYEFEDETASVDIVFPVYLAEKMATPLEEDETSYYSSSDEKFLNSDNLPADTNVLLSDYNIFLSKEQSSTADLGFISSVAAALFLGQYGEDNFKALSEFILENEIDDLHSGNMMFDKDGNIRIIDYSGFWG